VAPAGATAYSSRTFLAAMEASARKTMRRRSFFMVAG
jgi:hypothetical protein